MTAIATFLYACVFAVLFLVLMFASSKRLGEKVLKDSFMWFLCAAAAAQILMTIFVYTKFLANLS